MTSRPDTQTTRRRFLAATTGVVAGGVVTTESVSANHDAPPGGVFADGFASSRNFRSFVDGISSRYSTIGAPAGLQTLVDRVVNEFKANEAAWIDYGDWAAQEHDLTPLGDSTIAVDFAITRGRWPTRDEEISTTLQADFDTNSETYERVSWTIESAENPDYEAVIRNRAAENAADELQHFRREFIDTEAGHELPDEDYISMMAGRYGSSISFGEDTENVLELLLGGFDV